MISPSVICRTEPSGPRPAITYRQAGDRHVLVEYGEQDLDLRLNFVVVAVHGALLADRPPGLTEASPGLRSILIAFDPVRTGRTGLIDRLQRMHDELPEIASLVIPGRRITLPIAFDDTASREAVARYAATIRHDAPNVRGGGNIDFIVECNNLDDRDELYATVCATEWWTAFTGFFPGLPFLFPLDRGRELFAPKYNPTRSWTAEGAVGIGGACVAIYPVESPGSYQLFGRTVPIYDIHGGHSAFAADPFLIGPGDRIRFVAVSEDELIDARQRVFDDRYEYAVEDAPFVVADYLDERAGSGSAAPVWDGTDVP